MYKEITMTKKNIEKQLINVIDKVFNPKNSIKKNDHYKNDYGMDSFDQLDYAIAVEEEFDIHFSDSEIIELSQGTVKDTVDFLYEFMKPFKDE